mmetsp:Transcript_11916/g.39606  ORF Transcript_11916/g.39606 Transcript_11916/m.39606 type:complete len:242 (-) Transcript_11916:1763-2488(-)
MVNSFCCAAVSEVSFGSNQSPSESYIATSASTTALRTSAEVDENASVRDGRIVEQARSSASGVMRAMMPPTHLTGAAEVTTPRAFVKRGANAASATSGASASTTPSSASPAPSATSGSVGPVPSLSSRASRITGSAICANGANWVGELRAKSRSVNSACVLVSAEVSVPPAPRGVDLSAVDAANTMTRASCEVTETPDPLKTRRTEASARPVAVGDAASATANACSASASAGDAVTAVPSF